MAEHYILMGGDHGYMPDLCEVYETYEDAVLSAQDTYELTDDQTDDLRSCGSFEFPYKYPTEDMGEDAIVYGAEYCEIVECECDDPCIHSDN